MRLTLADSAGSFGTMLRDARERRGISLRQIADATKISVGQLEALERNDIARLPGGIFTRAFVRSYAMQVGLDPEQTVREFMGQFPQDSVTVGHPTSDRVEDNEAFESTRRATSVFVKLAALSVPIALIVLYVGVSVSRRSADPASASPTPVVATRPATPPSGPLSLPSVETSGQAAPAPTDPAPPLKPEAVDGAQRLNIGLSARERCWVSVVVDGERTIQRELAPGEYHTFDVHTALVLTAGNAGALALTLNGVAARPLGKPGEVVTTRLTLENFRNYLTATP